MSKALTEEMGDRSQKSKWIWARPQIKINLALVFLSEVQWSCKYKWKLFYPKIYSMFGADSECLSDVENFPPLHSLIKKCLNMKPDRNVESSHLGNGRSIAKIKMNSSKVMDKNKHCSRVSTRSALKKQADYVMIEFSRCLAELNEIFYFFSKRVF